MPATPTRACRCGGRIVREVCDRCGPTRTAREDRRQSAHRRGYDRAWQQLRAHFLAMHPWCVDCDAAGIATESVEVHHEQPIAEAPHRRLDPTNLTALCKSCHSKRTVIEEGNAGSVKSCTIVRFRERDDALQLVSSRRKPGDVVFDFDSICQAIGAGAYPRPPDVAQLVTAWRRELCVRIKSGQVRRRVWILCSDLTQAQALARETGGSVVSV